MLQYGETALHLAAWKGHIEEVKILMKYGAAVDVRNKVQPLLCRWEATRGESLEYQTLWTDYDSSEIQTMVQQWTSETRCWYMILTDYTSWEHEKRFVIIVSLVTVKI